MDDFITARWPNVAVTEVQTLPGAAEEEHTCPDLDGDIVESTVFTSYQRFGVTHGRSGCGLCIAADLVEMHHGNPQPVFVKVAVLAEVAAVASPSRAA